jgi:hypothetical protein
MKVVNAVNPTKVGFKDEKKGDFAKKAIGIGVSVAVLFATVWVVGKAWKESQKS